MKAVFKDCIKSGKIEVPDYLQKSFSGIVTITLDDQDAPATGHDEIREDLAAVQWFQSMLGTVPPFVPLSREEANERHPE